MNVFTVRDRLIEDYESARETTATEGWIAVYDRRSPRASADRSAFVEAVGEGAEAARSGNVLSHSEAVRVLESFGR